MLQGTSMNRLPAIRTRYTSETTPKMAQKPDSPTENEKNQLGGRKVQDEGVQVTEKVSKGRDAFV